jgi:hypothetical protein
LLISICSGFLLNLSCVYELGGEREGGGKGKRKKKNAGPAIVDFVVIAMGGGGRLECVHWYEGSQPLSTPLPGRNSTEVNDDVSGEIGKVFTTGGV